MAFNDLPRSCRLYIIALVGAGAAATLYSYPHPLLREPDASLIVFFGLAIATARMNVKIPYSNVSFSVDTAFVFAILMLYGLVPAVIADAAGKFVLSFGNLRQNAHYKMALNMASGILSVFGAYLAFHVFLFGEAANTAVYLLPIVAMTAVYYLINTITVAIAICFYDGQRILPFWIKNFLPTGIGYLMAGSIATLLFILDMKGGLLGFLVTIPLVVLIYFSQKIYLQKEEETFLHIDELEQINERLQAEINDREQAEREKAKLEEQLLQSQKMEAVGRLAGGVAHDFNNLLTGIIGYSDLLLSSDAGANMRSDLMEIKKAADRAAGLTKQLLAFSRKQIISPKVIDLNALIGESQKMLGRIIREDIELVFEPGGNLERIKADPVQIDQILVNLVVNARDSMPDGGKLIIRTTKETIREADSQLNIDSRPGRYVVLSVIDNGTGMDSETRKRIFEPFFTTKGEGKGTGLGLSTVYGIVKQNDGHIDLQSELGAGTTFRIYLPLVEEEIETVSETREESTGGGNESILLVEDEDMMRDLSKRILQGQGYTVLAAGNGEEALQICEEYEGDIHLLLTDVIMPKISGKELSVRMRTMKPEIRVLYMSGYSEDIIDHHGVLDEDIHFIQKPFTIDELVSKVHQVLAGESREPCAGGDGHVCEPLDERI